MQVTILTDDAKIKEALVEARKAYSERDARMADMTDESVDEFYSCSLCQSFAPNHVCVISPERLGLCGAVNWLDGKAGYKIDPTGGNQPVSEGASSIPARGEWEGINEFVYQHSNRTIERMSLYSLMDAPMTSCGCFECILALVPGGQRVHDRQPRVPRDDPLRHEVLDAGGVVSAAETRSPASSAWDGCTS